MIRRDTECPTRLSHPAVLPENRSLPEGTVFGLHCLMNLWWELFGVADTALGGWIANAARLLTIAVAILLTTYRDRFWRPLTNEGNAVDQTTDQSCGRGPSDRKLANSDEPFLIWQHAR